MKVHLPNVRTRGLRVLGILGAAAALAVGGLLVAPGPEPQEVQAFSQTWTAIRCHGTESTQHRSLHNDVAGAGQGNDAGYAFVTANDESNEFCIWGATVPRERSRTFRTLTVRAAVNDGSNLVVYVRTDTDCENGSNIGTLWFGDGGVAPADNAFHTRSVAIEAGIARSVCIRVSEDDADNSQRVSALLDNIALWRLTGVGWRETFSRTN